MMIAGKVKGHATRPEMESFIDEDDELPVAPAASPKRKIIVLGAGLALFAALGGGGFYAVSSGLVTLPSLAMPSVSLPSLSLPSFDFAPAGPKLASPMPPRSGPEDAKQSLLTPPPMPGQTAAPGPEPKAEPKADAVKPVPAAPPPPQPEAAAAPPAPAPAPLGDDAQKEAQKEAVRAAREALKGIAIAKPDAGQPPLPAAAQATASPPTGDVPRLPAFTRDPGHTPSFAALPPQPDLKPLSDAPISSLIQKTQRGSLPIVGTDGKQPWQVYARPFSAPAGKALVAVVVVDLGLAKDATEAAIAKMPPDVTLAFSPYASGLDKWLKQARAGGHEVLLGLPLEANAFPVRDGGPFSLHSTQPLEQNLARLETIMGKAGGYTGLITVVPGGGASPFTASKQMPMVLAALKDRGLLFVGATMDGEKKPPAAAVGVHADESPFRAAIDARLVQALTMAKRDGRVLIVVGAKPVSLERLAAWIESLAEAGAVVAPVSAVVK